MKNIIITIGVLLVISLGVVGFYIADNALDKIEKENRQPETSKEFVYLELVDNPHISDQQKIKLDKTIKTAPIREDSVHFVRLHPENFGKKPLTLWLTPAHKIRIKDYHFSGNDIQWNECDANQGTEGHICSAEDCQGYIKADCCQYMLYDLGKSSEEGNLYVIGWFRRWPSVNLPLKSRLTGGICDKDEKDISIDIGTCTNIIQDGSRYRIEYQIHASPNTIGVEPSDELWLEWESVKHLKFKKVKLRYFDKDERCFFREVWEAEDFADSLSSIKEVQGLFTLYQGKELLASSTVSAYVLKR